MSGEALDAGGLSPVKDGSEAWRKLARKELYGSMDISIKVDYTKKRMTNDAFCDKID